MLSAVSHAYTTPKQTPLATGVRPLETRISVHLTPRTTRDEIAGWQDDVLRVRVTAPPVDGKANAALERLLARALGLPKHAVGIVAGARGRRKTVAIAGLSRGEIGARFTGTSGR